MGEIFNFKREFYNKNNDIFKSLKKYVRQALRKCIPLGKSARPRVGLHLD